MNEIDFDSAFNSLTDNPPFPWQRALYADWFIKGRVPDACNLPTGLGKTSVIAIWLIAFANAPDRVPRRLVYVVNRRTVVDQTTDEVEKYLERKVPGVPELAVSTLRGQFADNRECQAMPTLRACRCPIAVTKPNRAGSQCTCYSRPSAYQIVTVLLCEAPARSLPSGLKTTSYPWTPLVFRVSTPNHCNSRPVSLSQIFTMS
jgi:CRISPR-associated helicase Cas3